MTLEAKTKATNLYSHLQTFTHTRTGTFTCLHLQIPTRISFTITTAIIVWKDKKEVAVKIQLCFLQNKP